MENKKIVKYFGMLVFLIVIITLLLSIFYNTAFVSSCILMTALFLFVICYDIKDNNKKIMYILFTVGVLLIIVSLVYTFMRLM